MFALTALGGAERGRREMTVLAIHDLPAAPWMSSAKEGSKMNTFALNRRNQAVLMAGLCNAMEFRQTSRCSSCYAIVFMRPMTIFATYAEFLSFRGSSQA